ncbi:uncharacterized protein A4U43_C06F3360 [Asparagus officinalis]|uniref:KIB1-4 beta-propeller domain-containing protein n=1 Tax=Asparagus officinalis TaxID=4686 RepID=A0A5P1EN80_ASPOF|nr:uncharacterized protein A4U43_C06F3360 [Asparagus officinalis]
MVYFEDYLVACLGELYLVRLHRRSTAIEVQPVSVTKRGSNNSEWVYVHDIDGCVIFLDLNEGFCASRSASELSLVGDCIYYVNIGETCFFCYDMKTDCTQANLPCHHVREGSWSRSMWVLPPL